MVGIEFSCLTTSRRSLRNNWLVPGAHDMSGKKGRNLPLDPDSRSDGWEHPIHHHPNDSTHSPDADPLRLGSRSGIGMWRGAQDSRRSHWEPLSWVLKTQIAADLGALTHSISPFCAGLERTKVSGVLQWWGERVLDGGHKPLN